MITDIYDLLYRLGVTAIHKGFFHTSYAVLLSVERMDRLLLVKKWLYPEVAKQYRTTPRCVEHNIRMVVAVAWLCNPELLQELARYPLTQKPTAAQFIAILAASLAHTDIPA